MTRRHAVFAAAIICLTTIGSAASAQSGAWMPLIALPGGMTVSQEGPNASQMLTIPSENGGLSLSCTDGHISVSATYKRLSIAPDLRELRFQIRYVADGTTHPGQKNGIWPDLMDARLDQNEAKTGNATYIFGSENSSRIEMAMSSLPVGERLMLEPQGRLQQSGLAVQFNGTGNLAYPDGHQRNPVSAVASQSACHQERVQRASLALPIINQD